MVGGNSLMKDMDNLIIDFLKHQTCASICCKDDEGNPYCFSCFYSFNSEKGLLYFKSSNKSSHIGYMNLNPVIAGTILQDNLHLTNIKGIQLQGTFLYSSEDISQMASNDYHKKYPFALLIPGKVWVIQIESIKMTNNSIGFNKKIQWHREEVVK